MRKGILRAAGCIYVVSLCVAGASGWSSAPESGLLAAIDSALPDRPSVQPMTPRRLLVFTLCKGFKHSSIPVGAKCVERMGVKTGAFEAVVSDDPGMFSPANLSRFDAVCLMNTTGTLFDDPALQTSFLEFVKSGKGLIGIHAATDCFYDWPEYGEMIGAYFDGHPWGANDTVTIKLDDPAHPVCAAFGGVGFSIQDEIYQFREPYSRSRLRVLLSIDTARTDMNKAGIKRTDGDFAVAWVSAYGKGRVFYCSLGHNEAVFQHPAVLQHYLDGIQFAMGDLPADTTPSAELTREYLEQSSVDVLLERLRTYEYGEDTPCLEAVSGLTMKAQEEPERRRWLAERLSAFLETDCTLAAKQFICRQLYVIGSEESVPVLYRMLLSDDTADMARYALERMATPAAGRALQRALQHARGSPRVGIIHSLGERREQSAAIDLIGLLRDKDPATATAAIRALGKIGGPDAAGALLRIKVRTPPPALRADIDDALLKCADSLRSQGDPDKAYTLYAMLFEPGESPQTRAAALQGIALIKGPEAAHVFVAALDSIDKEVRDAAAAALRDTPGSTFDIIAAFQRMNPESLALALHVLAECSGPDALEAVLPLVEHNVKTVRVAAINALERIGDASAVRALARTAVYGEADEAKAARRSLDRLRGPGINAAIVECLADNDPKVRAASARTLAARFARDHAPALLDAATDPDESVRTEAFRALAVLARGEDMPQMVSLLLGEEEDSARNEAAAAVVAGAGRIPPPTLRSEAVLAALPGTKNNPEARAALIRILGELGENAALATVRSCRKERDPQVKEAAIRALAGWPSPAALPELDTLSASAPTPALRTVALRGYIRLLGEPSDRPPAKTVRMYKQALRRAQGAEEQRAAIAGLAATKEPAAIEVLNRYAKTPELEREVEQAIEALEKDLLAASASHNPDDAQLAIDRDPMTRWTTGTAQSAGQWFEVDLGREKEIDRIILDAGTSTNDFPREYVVRISTSARRWGRPVASGIGASARIEIAFSPKKGRYVRIEQTGTADFWWSIHEVSFGEK
mgnify:CR=1 FL=1